MCVYVYGLVIVATIFYVHFFHGHFAFYSIIEYRTMNYVRQTFANLLNTAGSVVSTKQTDLFWSYSTGGVPVITYALLAATTVILATSTIAMSMDQEGGSEQLSAPSVGGAIKTKRNNNNHKHSTTKRRR
jgi:hypothetical protein